jgi:hypothetical protein
MITRFSPKQISILTALARYKFLTYSQMMQLGIDQHRSNLSLLLKDLRESKFQMVKKIPHGMGEEVKHYLNEKAILVLKELSGLEEQEIHCPRGTILTHTQDQAHRTSIINFHITLDLACQKAGVALLFCDRYFDTVGNNRVEKNLKSKTAFEVTGSSSIKPDVTFMLQSTLQKELFLVELENGRDSKKSIEKCIRHGEAMLTGAVNKRYDFQSGYRILWIFEHEGAMEAVIKDLHSRPLFEPLTEYFLFKPLSKIGEDIFLSWRNVAGKERKMFY